MRTALRAFEDPFALGANESTLLPSEEPMVPIRKEPNGVCKVPGHPRRAVHLMPYRPRRDEKPRALDVAVGHREAGGHDAYGVAVNAHDFDPR